LDLTKTRLQIQGEKSGDGALMAKRGMFRTAAGIGKVYLTCLKSSRIW
jgi:hypothetical protein